MLLMNALSNGKVFHSTCSAAAGDPSQHHLLSATKISPQLLG
jgi:hypothetical protein